LVLASVKLPLQGLWGLMYENIDTALAEVISSKLYAQLNKGV